MAKSLRERSLKSATITMGDSKDVRDTKILDGEAKDSPVWNENNETVQYKESGSVTKTKGELGGRNDPEG